MIDSDQFIRAYDLEIGELRFRSTGSNGLRMAFNVERDTTPVPNNAEIAIWNLNADSRAEIESFASNTVRLQVGYESGISEIFFGVLRDGFTTREGPDLVTRLSAGDGEDKFLVNTVSKTYSKGTPVLTVLSDLVDKLGLGQGNLIALTNTTLRLADGSTELRKAMTISGSVATELKIWCASLGLEYSVQAGEFIVTQIGQPASTLGPLISPKTGLVETPAVDEKGVVTGTALCLPDLVPSVAFQLESERVSGTYKATKTKHFGDWADNSWYVQFEGTPI